MEHLAAPFVIGSIESTFYSRGIYSIVALQAVESHGSRNHFYA